MTLPLQRHNVLRFRQGARIKSYSLEHAGIDRPKTSKAFIRPLGEGGSGVVFRARQTLHASVSIKRALKFFMFKESVAVLTKHKNAGPISSVDFLNEIVNISSFSHEHLIKVVDAGIYNVRNLDVPFIVTEFIEGPTLQDVIEADAKSTVAHDALEHLIAIPERMIELLIQIASGILHLHERSFAHCDIAPKNIFLKQSERFRPVVGDLGVGRNRNQPTRSVFIAGSEAYMPPEVKSCRYKDVGWETFEKLQPRWDLYGFAKMAAELISTLPTRVQPTWRQPLMIALNECMAGARYRTLGSLIERLKWLAPIHRQTAAVPEISSASNDTSRKLMPVESLIVSRRIHELVNHPSLLRLGKVPQLTTVHYLFPGAVHSRYEHSLGVMETMRKYIMSLLDHSEFLEHLSSAKIETALICALFSNLVKFPFSNVLLEIKSKDPGKFESFSKKSLLAEVCRVQDRHGESLSDVIRRLFPQVDLKCVRNILTDRKEAFAPEDHLIHSMLNSSLDARLVDYVRRDALHLGLEGGSVDLNDLLPFLTIREHRLALAINGLSVAEQIISLRYWMFQRVYWNRPNRTLAAMVRHLLMKLSRNDRFLPLLRQTVLSASEDDILNLLSTQARRQGRKDLVDLAALLRNVPQELYHIGLEANIHEMPALAGVCEVVKDQTYEELAALGEKIGDKVSQFLNSSGNRNIVPILVDFPYEPPGGIKLGGDLSCVLADGSLRPLNQVSGIIGGVNHSFDEYLRRLRVLIHPRCMPKRQEKEKRIALRAAIYHYLISVV